MSRYVNATNHTQIALINHASMLSMLRLEDKGRMQCMGIKELSLDVRQSKQLFFFANAYKELALPWYRKYCLH